MSVWKIYRYEDQVLVPKMFINEDGAFVETEPLLSVSIYDSARLVEVLKETLSVAPVAADLPQSDDDTEEPDKTPVVLHKLGLKKWHEFETKALMYTLHLSGENLAVYITGRNADGMWSVSGSEQLEYFVANGLDEACKQIAAEICSRKPVKSTALGLPLHRE